MAKYDVRSEWMAAQGEFKLALRNAGLESAWKELTDKFQIYNTPNPEAHDLDLRRLVFGVHDEALRRQVIHWDRECVRLMYAAEAQELSEFRKEVRNVGDKIRSNALWGLLILGPVMVLIAGNWGIVSAVAAATAFLLYGFNRILEADRRAIQSVKDAEQKARDQEAYLETISGDAMFSESEELTGIPDADR